MTGNLLDHPPFEPEVLRAGNRGSESADGGSRYLAPRLVELTRWAANAICDEAGCRGVARHAGRAS